MTANHYFCTGRLTGVRKTRKIKPKVVWMCPIRSPSDVFSGKDRTIRQLVFGFGTEMSLKEGGVNEGPV